MFSRFSVQARLVLFHARGAVSRVGSLAIEPEHLVLGLLDEGTGLACRFIARSGPVDDVRHAILSRLPRLGASSDHDEIPFSPDSMQVLKGAVAEADRLSHEAVGTEHLLLGLLRLDRGVAVDVLRTRGLRIETVRAAILEHQ